MLGKLTVIAASFAFSHVLHAGTMSLRSGTADGGGGHSQGNRFAIEGTVGQPDTGKLAGFRFALAGGFWPAPATSRPAPIFRSSFED